MIALVYQPALGRAYLEKKTHWGPVWAVNYVRGARPSGPPLAVSRALWSHVCSQRRLGSNSRQNDPSLCGGSLGQATARALTCGRLQSQQPPRGNVRATPETNLISFDAARKIGTK